MKHDNQQKYIKLQQIFLIETCSKKKIKMNNDPENPNMA